MSNTATSQDPCGEFGTTQRFALLWFFVAVLIGGVLVWQLSAIDRWMYDHNGEFLDYDAYKENRRVSTSIPSEEIDPRQAADISAVRKKLKR